MSNTITAFFKGREGVAESIYQHDYGRVLVIDGLNLPAVFEAHFTTLSEDDAITVIGQNNRVAIPDSCINKTGIVTVYIYLHSGDNDGETEYVIRFAVVHRAKPDYDATDEEKTEFESAIQTAIAMLQNPKKVNQPLDEYYQVDYGTAGQLLRTKGDGSTEWVDEGLPTDEQTAEAVSAWLDEHPEATTTVQDGAITQIKLNGKLNAFIEGASQQDISVQYVATQIMPYYQSALSINEPNEPEGIAVIDDHHVVAFYVSTDGTDGWPLENAPTKVIEYSVADNITGTSVSRTSTITGLKHANSCGYNPDTDEIYVATTGYTNGSDTNIRTAEIVILDYTTLTVKSTVTVDLSDVSGISQQVLNVISYDKINKKLYGCTTNQIYEIDTETWVGSNVISCGTDFAYLTQGTQGMAVIGNLAYICFSNPNVILCYSLSEGILLRIFNIPRADDDGHVIAQPQDIDYDPTTGNIYLNAFQGLGAINSSGDGNQWRANYIFKFNPVAGAIMNSRQPNNSTPTDTRTIYVDNSVTSVYQKGTSSFPFKTINEAVNAVKFGVKEATIVNIKAGTYNEYVLTYGVNILFTGGAITIRGLFSRASVLSFDMRVTVNGNYFTGNSIRIIGSHIGFQYLESSLNTSSQMISVIDSWVSVRDRVKLTGTGTGYAISATNSTIKIDILDSSTFKKFFFQSTNLEKSILPSNSDIVGEVWCKCEIAPGLPQTYSISRYEGILSVAINVNISGASGTKRCVSAPMRKYLNDSSVTLPVTTWFGIVNVVLDSTLQLQSITPLYVMDGFDASNITYSLQRIYLGL